VAESEFLTEYSPETTDKRYEYLSQDIRLLGRPQDDLGVMATGSQCRLNLQGKKFIWNFTTRVLWCSSPRLNQGKNSHTTLLYMASERGTLFPDNSHMSFRRSVQLHSAHITTLCHLYWMRQWYWQSKIQFGQICQFEHLKNINFWVVTSCNPADVHWRFEETYCLHFQERRVDQAKSKHNIVCCLAYSSTLKKEYVPPKRRWTSTILRGVIW
jgi:hypothetical protein